MAAVHAAPQRSAARHSHGQRLQAGRQYHQVDGSTTEAGVEVQGQYLQLLWQLPAPRRDAAHQAAVLKDAVGVGGAGGEGLGSCGWEQPG